MRLLLVSDLHYSLKQLDWVTSAAADYDLVVVVGDLLDISSHVEADAQIVVVLEYLARMSAKTTVVACSGNHDLNVRNDVGERAGALARRRAAIPASSSTAPASSPTTCSSPWARGGTAR